MSCTILLAAFSGLLRDQQMLPKPIDSIETWDDLYERKDIKIRTSMQSEFEAYLANFPDDIRSVDFIQRTTIEAYDIEKGLTGNYSKFDVNEIKHGKLALIYPINHIKLIKAERIPKDFREGIDYHIGEGKPQPSFAITNNFKFGPEMKEVLNHV